MWPNPKIPTCNSRLSSLPPTHVCRCWASSCPSRLSDAWHAEAWPWFVSCSFVSTARVGDIFIKLWTSTVYSFDKTKKRETTISLWFMCSPDVNETYKCRTWGPNPGKLRLKRHDLILTAGFPHIFNTFSILNSKAIISSFSFIFRRFYLWNTMQKHLQNRY